MKPGYCDVTPHFYIHFYITPDCKLLKPSYVDYKVHTSEMFDFLYYHRISPDVVISHVSVSL